MNKVRAAPDEVSPITGNFCVFVDRDTIPGTEIRLCGESGYTNVSGFIATEENLAELAAEYPIGYAVHKIDDYNRVWIPLSSYSGGISDIPGKRGGISLTPARRPGSNLVWILARGEDSDIEIIQIFSEFEYSAAFDLYLSLLNSKEND